jgi:hypothetical protein
LSVSPILLNEDNKGLRREKKMRTDEQIIEELKTATAGLFVMSESDYPFEIIRWDGQIAITPEYLRSIAGGPADCPIEETDLDTFFRPNGMFRAVVASIKDSLSDVRVYKVGTINIPVFIVGRNPEGNWLGLSTRLVQT